MYKYIHMYIPLAGMAWNAIQKIPRMPQMLTKDRLAKIIVVDIPTHITMEFLFYLVNISVRICIDRSLG